MYQIIVLDIDKGGIKETAHWYNKKQEGLGKRFINDIKAKVAVIKNNPIVFGIRYKQVRTAVLDIFPFMIHFIINDKNILITAVLHTSRNPDSWSER